MLEVGVIGGGINGVMAAWELCRRGCRVELFERHRLISETSRASTKMLHGGLRYLEHGHFRLVREALRERDWWLEQAPALTNPVEILLPIYCDRGRPAWLVGAGVGIYKLLATGTRLPKGRWYSPSEVATRLPDLDQSGLRGAYSYWDGQMDDYRLGHWAARQAVKDGLVVNEGARVEQIEPSTGTITINGSRRTFDRVINVTGPWACQLLSESAISSNYRLDLVRGSHVLLAGTIDCGCVLQVPGEQRILFVLPYQGNIMLGTTEVLQHDPENAVPDQKEIDYLLVNYKKYFCNNRSRVDVLNAFSGVRPIVASRNNISKASREFVIERQQRLINVFGGKWTTSRSLALAVMNATLPD